MAELFFTKINRRQSTKTQQIEFNRLKAYFLGYVDTVIAYFNFIVASAGKTTRRHPAT